MVFNKLKYIGNGLLYSAITFIALSLLLTGCRKGAGADASATEYYVLDPGTHFQQSRFSISLDQTEYRYSAPHSHTVYIPDHGPAIGVAINSIGDYWEYEGIAMNVTIKIHGDKAINGIPSNTIIDLSKPDADYRISVSVSVSEATGSIGIGAGDMGGAGGGSMGGPSGNNYSVWVGELIKYWDTDPVAEWVSGTEGTLTISDFQVNISGNGPPEFNYNVQLNNVVLYSEFDSTITRQLPNGIVLPNFLVINSATFCVSETGCS